MVLLPLLQIKHVLAASSYTFLEAAGLLASEVATATAASCFRAVLQMQLSHMQLALQRVLHLQALKSAALLPLLSSLPEQDLALVLCLPGIGSSLVVGPLGVSTGSGTSTDCTTASSSSSSIASGWKATLSGAVAASKGSAEQWSQLVLGIQEEVLSSVTALGQGALAMHARYHSGDAAALSAATSAATATSSTSRSTAASGQSPAGGAAAAVQQLLEKVPGVWQSVQQDTAAAEMAGVLQAMYDAEFGRGYGSMVSFMRGHLHQCPNGHFFMIGECGGAMQESRCLECGAAVGGRRHQLASGNQRADESVLQQLSEQWAAS